MGNFTRQETLSRVAGCFGWGLERRDQGGTAGFVIFDLRQPDFIVAYSTDPNDPFTLDDAAAYLRKHLENLDPDELEIAHVANAEDHGVWRQLFGISVILSAADFYLQDTMAAEIADIVSPWAADILAGIIDDALQGQGSGAKSCPV